MSRIIFIFVFVDIIFLVNNIHICICSSEKLFATVWFGGLTKARLNQFAHKLIKLPHTETEIALPPKQVHRSSRWHMKDKKKYLSFLDKV